MHSRQPRERLSVVIAVRGRIRCPAGVSDPASPTANAAPWPSARRLSQPCARAHWWSRMPAEATAVSGAAGKDPLPDREHPVAQRERLRRGRLQQHDAARRGAGGLSVDGEDPQQRLERPVVTGGGLEPGLRDAVSEREAEAAGRMGEGLDRRDAGVRAERDPVRARGGPRRVAGIFPREDFDRDAPRQVVPQLALPQMRRASSRKRRVRSSAREPALIRTSLPVRLSRISVSAPSSPTLLGSHSGHGAAGARHRVDGSRFDRFGVAEGLSEDPLERVPVEKTDQVGPLVARERIRFPPGHFGAERGPVLDRDVEAEGKEQRVSGGRRRRTRSRTLAQPRNSAFGTLPRSSKRFPDRPHGQGPATMRPRSSVRTLWQGAPRASTLTSWSRPGSPVSGSSVDASRTRRSAHTGAWRNPASHSG